MSGPIKTNAVSNTLEAIDRLANQSDTNLAEPEQKAIQSISANIKKLLANKHLKIQIDSEQPQDINDDVSRTISNVAEKFLFLINEKDPRLAEATRLECTLKIQAVLAYQQVCENANPKRQILIDLKQQLSNYPLSDPPVATSAIRPFDETRKTQQAQRLKFKAMSKSEKIQALESFLEQHQRAPEEPIQNTDDLDLLISLVFEKNVIRNKRLITLRDTIKSFYQDLEAQKIDAILSQDVNLQKNITLDKDLSIYNLLTKCEELHEAIRSGDKYKITNKTDQLIAFYEKNNKLLPFHHIDNLESYQSIMKRLDEIKQLNDQYISLERSELDANVVAPDASARPSTEPIVSIENKKSELEYNIQQQIVELNKIVKQTTRFINDDISIPESASTSSDIGKSRKQALLKQDILTTAPEEVSISSTCIIRAVEIQKFRTELRTRNFVYSQLVDFNKELQQTDVPSLANKLQQFVKMIYPYALHNPLGYTIAANKPERYPTPHYEAWFRFSQKLQQHIVKDILYAPNRGIRAHKIDHWKSISIGLNTRGAHMIAREISNILCSQLIHDINYPSQFMAESYGGHFTEEETQIFRKYQDAKNYHGVLRQIAHENTIPAIGKLKSYIELTSNNVLNDSRIITKEFMELMDRNTKHYPQIQAPIPDVLGVDFIGADVNLVQKHFQDCLQTIYRESLFPMLYKLVKKNKKPIIFQSANDKYIYGRFKYTQEIASVAQKNTTAAKILSVLENELENDSQAINSVRKILSNGYIRALILDYINREDLSEKSKQKLKLAHIKTIIQLAQIILDQKNTEVDKELLLLDMEELFKNYIDSELSNDALASKEPSSEEEKEKIIVNADTDLSPGGMADLIIEDYQGSQAILSSHDEDQMALKSSSAEHQSTWQVAKPTDHANTQARLGFLAPPERNRRSHVVNSAADETFNFKAMTKKYKAYHFYHLSTKEKVTFSYTNALQSDTVRENVAISQFEAAITIDAIMATLNERSMTRETAIDNNPITIGGKNPEMVATAVAFCQHLGIRYQLKPGHASTNVSQATIDEKLESFKHNVYPKYCNQAIIPEIQHAIGRIGHYKNRP